MTFVTISRPVDHAVKNGFDAAIQPVAAWLRKEFSKHKKTPGQILEEQTRYETARRSVDNLLR